MMPPSASEIGEPEGRKSTPVPNDSCDFSSGVVRLRTGPQPKQMLEMGLPESGHRER